MPINPCRFHMLIELTPSGLDIVGKTHGITQPRYNRGPCIHFARLQAAFALGIDD